MARMLRGFFETQLQQEREARRWEATLRQHESAAIPLRDFAAGVSSSVQFVCLHGVMGVYDLALATQLPEGPVVYAFLFGIANDYDLDPLTHHGLPWLRKCLQKAPFDTVLEAGPVLGVTEVRREDSLFGPMLPLEPTRTYRIELPLRVRVLALLMVLVGVIQQFSTITFMVKYYTSTSRPVDKIMVAECGLVWLGIFYFVYVLWLQGKTIEICDSELPADFGTKHRFLRIPRDSRIKYQRFLNPNWIVRVEDPS